MMLSIIIPVYNTEKYLPKCLDSILNQSYKEYEIIAVNDGSTDESLSVLREYARKDGRINIIDKNNEGQGIARNTAIEKAKGELLYFVDSDDWITADSLSLMMGKFFETNADIVIGNSAVTHLDSEEIKRYQNEKVHGILEKNTIKDSIFDISASACPKMIKKKLFIENNISFPGIFFEDLATLPRLFAVADTIAIVEGCVYIQRANSHSTVYRPDAIYDRIKFIDYLIAGFKELGIYNEYEKSLTNYLKVRAQINLRMVRSLANKIYVDFSEKQREVFKEKCAIDTLTNKKAFGFGSYNLMLYTKIFMGLEDSATVENYFGGSSLISCMDENNAALNRMNIVYENDFRRKMLVNEFGRRLLRMNPGEFYGNKYFFIDLLEERYDIGVYKGEYFTINPAFEDISSSLNMTYRVIKAFNDEWWELWEKSCIAFIDKIRLVVQDQTVVLVKSYLSEMRFDDDGEELFEKIDEIKEINFNLRKCYVFFERHFKEAKPVDIMLYDEYKTAKNFRHGCYPWHLSDYGYGIIASRIESEITKSEMT